MEPNIKLYVENFNLKYTLECGQCFRWKAVECNEYIGVIQDRVLRVKQIDNLLYVWSNKEENLEEVVKHYFALDIDYNALEKQIAKIDANVKKSLEFSSGIRILRQPLFETYISYIISANNNISRISKSVDLIAKKCGKPQEFEGKIYYTFPDVQGLSKLTMDDLLSCGVGFRARYILRDVELLQKEDLSVLCNMDTLAAYNKLVEYQGIGPKVADCILLFALERYEVFPVDVWVKRIMEKLYFETNTSLKTIREYATLNFGKYAGIVQQHLFFNVREGNM